MEGGFGRRKEGPALTGSLVGARTVMPAFAVFQGGDSTTGGRKRTKGLAVDILQNRVHRLKLKYG